MFSRALLSHLFVADVTRSSSSEGAKASGKVPSMIRGTPASELLRAESLQNSPWYDCLPLPDMTKTSPERKMSGRGGSWRDAVPSKNTHAWPNLRVSFYLQGVAHGSHDMDTRGIVGSSLVISNGAHESKDRRLTPLGRHDPSTYRLAGRS